MTTKRQILLLGFDDQTSIQTFRIVWGLLMSLIVTFLAITFHMPNAFWILPWTIGYCALGVVTKLNVIWRKQK